MSEFKPRYLAFGGRGQRDEITPRGRVYWGGEWSEAEREEARRVDEEMSGRAEEYRAVTEAVTGAARRVAEAEQQTVCEAAGLPITCGVCDVTYECRCHPGAQQAEVERLRAAMRTSLRWLLSDEAREVADTTWMCEAVAELDSALREGEQP